MDLATVLTAVTSSLGISAAAAAWLARSLVSHRLTKDLEDYKAGIQEDLERAKAEWEGQIHQQVELFLGDKAADREYQLEARKRLYRALGPLRFQLLLACRDIAGRIEGHGLRESYLMNTRDYYGRSTLYRLLRPLAISELIERQITYADFSVDPDAVGLLRFKRAAFLSFTGSVSVLNHPGVNWKTQEQHIYFDNLSRAVNALITRVGEEDWRTMRYDEFEHLVNKDSGRESLEPLPRLLDEFDKKRKPVFWLRLVGYAYLCNEHVNRTGRGIGFEQREFDLRNVLLASEDPHIRQNIESYLDAFKKLPELPL